MGDGGGGSGGGGGGVDPRNELTGSVADFRLTKFRIGPSSMHNSSVVQLLGWLS